MFSNITYSKKQQYKLNHNFMKKKLKLTFLNFMGRKKIERKQKKLFILEKISTPFSFMFLTSNN